MKYVIIGALLGLNLWAVHEGFTKANEQRKFLTGAILFETHRACNAPNV
jgi:hypothetical protein